MTRKDAFKMEHLPSVIGPPPAYYTHDGNKNVSELVDDNETIVAHYEYEAFGAVCVKNGTSTDENPWGFSSEYNDDVLRLVYYNYRHYEPVMGRWCNRDFINDTVQIYNLYGFCENAPSLFFDKRGLSTVDFKDIEIDRSIYNSGSDLGETRITRKIHCVCKKDSPSCKWKLVDVNVELTPVVYIYRKDTINQIRNLFAIKCEHEHIDDIKNAKNQLLTSLDTIIESNSSRVYSSQEGCESANVDKFAQTINLWFNSVSRESKRRYDDTGRHTW